MDSSPKSPILQACAIPFRHSLGALEFCLITSMRKQHRWGFPKGIIDPGETEIETALKEAQEEAGLVGQIVGEPLGQYWYSKWNCELLVTVFLMQVHDAQDEWPEASLRKRRWANQEQARQWLHRPRQRELLEVAIGRLQP